MPTYFAIFTLPDADVIDDAADIAPPSFCFVRLLMEKAVHNILRHHYYLHAAFIFNIRPYAITSFQDIRHTRDYTRQRPPVTPRILALLYCDASRDTATFALFAISSVAAIPCRELSRYDEMSALFITFSLFKSLMRHFATLLLMIFSFLATCCHAATFADRRAACR